MTLPDEFADVLAGTVEVAAPQGTAQTADAQNADAQNADDRPAEDGQVRALQDEELAGEELVTEVEEVLLGADGHVDLRLLADVQVELAVELGRVSLPLRALLGLAPGSVLQLNRPADAPVDVLVNDSPVSRGEVVVLDGLFGVRVTSLVER